MQYVIREAAYGADKKGQPLWLTLGRRSEQVKAVYWGPSPMTVAVCQEGAVVEVDGTIGEYKGERQLTVTSLALVPPASVHAEDFLPESPLLGSREDRLCMLKLNIEGIHSEPLRTLLRETLLDGVDGQRYVEWPASVMYHHAWRGGLLDHSLEVADIARRIASNWPMVNVDLVTAGALLHDVGKINEISVGTSYSFTTAGRLRGHVTLGLSWLDRWAQLRNLDPNLHQALAHIIASHHGELEHGTSVRPQTPEALAVHLADLTSSRMEMCRAAIAGHSGPEEFTAWDRATKTQFYVVRPLPGQEIT